MRLIKLTSNPAPEMIHRLRKAAEMVGASRRVLVCRTRRKIQEEGLLVTGAAAWLRDLASRGDR